MIYFIYGDQPSLIKHKIKKITKEALEVKDEMNFASFDANNVLVQDIVDEANYVPLGYDNKVVVMENAYFLLKNKTKNKIESDQDYNVLIDYINNPSDSTEFIITVIGKELDEKSEIVALLKEKAKVSEANLPDKDNWRKYVKDYVNISLKATIEPDAVNELALRCEGDMMLMQNNAKKLALYTNHIRYEDVLLLVTPRLEEDAFQLYNYLISGRKENALNLYKDLRVANVEPVSLITMLSNQFRLLNEIMFLSRKKLSDDDIGKILNIKPVRAKIIRKQVSLISEKQVHKILKDLYNLDLNIKSGLVDRFYAFELFLINFQVN